MTTISIIVAADENNAIGKSGGMLAHLPADLRYFKSVTEGHPVIMGRKTFESLPKGALPNRRNIVITRNRDLHFEGCEMCSSLSEAIALCEGEPEVFVIGGGVIYGEAMKIADVLYLTRIHHKFDVADTFFPSVDESEWQKVWQEDHRADEKNGYDYTFIKFLKINR